MLLSIKNLSRLFAAISIFAAASSPAKAASGVIEFSGTGNRYAVTVPAKDGGWDSMWFYSMPTEAVFDGGFDQKTLELNYDTTTLAARVRLQSVELDDVFSIDKVEAGAFPDINNGALLAPRPVRIDETASFYLGVQVGSPTGWRNSLGWVLLESTSDGNLRMLDSYVAYGADQIIVGQVPEASTSAQVLIGLFAIAGISFAKRRTAKRGVLGSVVRA